MLFLVLLLGELSIAFSFLPSSLLLLPLARPLHDSSCRVSHQFVFLTRESGTRHTYMQVPWRSNVCEMYGIVA